jgi:hypothetical protein
MNEIGGIALLDRPQEGDLIYVPMLDRLLVIKYVSKNSVWYQMGAIQMYDLVCETFEYSSERLRTGIDAIDTIEQQRSLDLSIWGFLTNDGYYITDNDGYEIIQSDFSFEQQATDTFEDNTEFQLEGEVILDWTQIDPFSEGEV